MLVDGTLAVGATTIGEISAHRALEEGLAALAGELAVVLARALVAADHALDVRLIARAARGRASVSALAAVWRAKLGPDGRRRRVLNRRARQLLDVVLAQ